MQKIQKLYELKEFLGNLKQQTILSNEDLVQKMIQSVGKWGDRSPSNAFDKLNVWDDILRSRELFLHIYSDKIKGFEQALNSSKELADTQTLLYVQAGKGAFKMGRYDASDRYLKHALTVRQDNHSTNLKIICPMIKLKA